ncbi:MAG: hypothetical protein U0694_20380, partial [Anaerolineae bacterium]
MSMEHNDHQHQPHEGGLSAPPRWLLWGVIGLFVLAIVGGAAGIWVFRDVLRPSQQQRVMDMLPFMRAFMRGGEALPTPELQTTSTISAADLLNMPIVIETATPTLTETPNVTATPVAVVPTASPTVAATDVPAATQAATLIPTPTPTTAAPTLASVAPSLPNANRLYGFVHVQQDWNNCGAANVTMALSYYGWTEDMSVAASYLKTDRE